jgi:hypothetical protein
MLKLNNTIINAKNYSMLSVEDGRVWLMRRPGHTDSECFKKVSYEEALEKAKEFCSRDGRFSMIGKYIINICLMKEVDKVIAHHWDSDNCVDIYKDGELTRVHFNRYEEAQEFVDEFYKIIEAVND